MVYGSVNPVYTVEGSVVLISFTAHDGRTKRTSRPNQPQHHLTS